MKITLDQFCDQWARNGKQRAWHSLSAKNAEDFATTAGEYTRTMFATSFAQGGFYGSSTRWAPRQSKWGKKFTHPLMIDTGELSSKIKGEKSSLGSYSTFGKRDYKRRYRYDIWTEEKSTPIRGKRGKRSTKNQTYAAVHNTDPKFGLYTVNQYSSRRPAHRQFIGFNDKINYVINTFFVPQIFEGFPK